MPIFAPFSFFEKNLPGSGLDPDAEAFLLAAGISDETITDAINQLVLDLKAASLWTKSNAIYPFVGGTATTHKFNLVNPADTDAAFRLSFTGGMTHSSNGITGNGTSNYATTYMNASTELAGGSPQNDNHMFYYGRSIPADNGIDMGSNDQLAGNTTIQFNARNASNAFNTFNMNATLDGSTNSATAGVFGMTRNSSTQYTKFANTTKTVYTRTSGNPPARDIFIMCQNNNGTAANFQNRNMALVSLGYGLSDTDIDNWVTINETFQTALGRFV